MEVIHLDFRVLIAKYSGDTSLTFDNKQYPRLKKYLIDDFLANRKDDLNSPSRDVFQSILNVCNTFSDFADVLHHCNEVQGHGADSHDAPLLVNQTPPVNKHLEEQIFQFDFNELLDVYYRNKETFKLEAVLNSLFVGATPDKIKKLRAAFYEHVAYEQQVSEIFLRIKDDYASKKDGFDIKSEYSDQKFDELSKDLKVRYEMFKQIVGEKQSFVTASDVTTHDFSETIAATEPEQLYPSVPKRDSGARQKSLE